MMKQGIRQGISMPEHFFHSNISNPHKNQIYLERPQVDNLLEKSMQSTVLTVIAGAGYGKTHSVYSFLQKFKVRTAWIQLSERDNLEERFWENFTAAVGSISADTMVKLKQNGFPGTDRQFERYLLIPAGDISFNLKYAFVFDDVHLVQNKTVVRFLERSVTSPFPNITSVLISRTEPDINLVKLLSKGRLAKITEENLRFSQDEMVEYFHIQNIRLSPDTVSAIYRDTEGWAFAIHLAALSLINAPPGSGYVPSAMRSNIFKLIESEIIAVVSPKLRKFLIKLSLVEHLSRDLLEMIACGPSLIEEMEKIESFIQFDSYLDAYRIHHLLLEYLSGKQDELTAQEKKDVYTLTAQWCAANNQKMDAISYYEKSGQIDQLIRVVYTLPMALPDTIAQFLLDLLNRIPEKTLSKFSTSYVLHARLLLTLGRFEEAIKENKDLIQKFEARPPSPFSYRILLGAYNNLGFISMLRSIHTGIYDFAPYFEKARQYQPLSGFEVQGPMRVASLGSYICRVGSVEKGKIEAFINALSTAVPHIAASMNGCTYGMDDLAKTELAYFRGELDKAEQYAMEGLRKARERNQYEIENRAWYYLLRLNLARGNYEKIQEIFTFLEAQLKEPEYLNRYIFYDIVTGWFYAQTEQSGKIPSWLKNDFEESELNSMFLGMETLVRTKWYLSEKRYPAALASLESQENQYGLGAFVFGKVAIKALEAVSLYHTGKKEEAIRSLEAAYTLAEPNSLYMSFIELGKNMRALTGAALKDQNCAIPRAWLERIKRLSAAYAQRVFSVAERCREPRQETRETGLSPREMAVLVGISQGLTREEIAGASSISVNTVKSTIRSVYNKLGAVNRANAVRIATAKGLLDPKNGG
jgi:LuxR family maltose regulon positive regulatory protein